MQFHCFYYTVSFPFRIKKPSLIGCVEVVRELMPLSQHQDAAWISDQCK